jgi:hypothetical protein
MILDLHRQGISVSAIARRVGLDRKTVRKYIASGLEPPVYGPRKPRPTRLAPFLPYLRERVAAYPDLTGRRLHRELRERGYAASDYPQFGCTRSAPSIMSMRRDQPRHITMLPGGRSCDRAR